MIRPSRISPDILINESLGTADLAASPMSANGMRLLIYARDNEGITLTKSGGFFRKFVTWAAHEFRWPEHEPEKLFAVNKVLNEQDFFPLAVMHSLMLATRLIRHYKGKAVLTKAGRAMIGDDGRLQAVLFDAYCATLNLSEYERFPMEYEDADLRHCLGVVQNRLDDWVVLADLAGWCLVFGRRWQSSGGQRLPLSQGNRATFFVGLAVDEVAFQIEMVVDIRMNGGEFLHRLHLPKPQHCPVLS